MAKGALSMLTEDPSSSALSQIPGMLNQLVPQDESSKWLAFSAGMGAPTKTGALSESIANTAAAQLDQRNSHERLKAAYAPLIANIFETQAKQQQAARMQALINSVLGPEVDAGAFSPAADGMGPTMPASMRQAPGSRLANLSLDQVAMLKANGVDLFDQYKWAKDPQKEEGGSFYTDRTTGKTTYRPKVPEGANMDSAGNMSSIPGLGGFTTAQTMATELPKALSRSIGTVNLRKNADGTESPRTEFSENPMLQDYLSSLNGGMPPAPRPAASAPRAAPPAMRQAEPPPQPGVRATEGADPNDPALIAAINDIKDPQERANARAALLKPGVGYGKTTEQQIAEEAAKTKAVKGAEADVVRDTGNKADAKRFNQMQAGIENAIKLLESGPTGSGLGRAVDAGAAFFGGSTQGAELSQRLKVAAGWLTSNVPRMEGPQSDKDVVRYAEMAGMVGDESIPVKRRLEAAKEVRNLQNKYAKLNGWEPVKPEGQWDAPEGKTPPAFSSDAIAAELERRKAAKK